MRSKWEEGQRQRTKQRLARALEEVGVDAYREGWDEAEYGIWSEIEERWMGGEETDEFCDWIRDQISDFNKAPKGS